MKINLSKMLSLFLLFVQACITPKGLPGVSDNIKDAKEKKVFIKEYTVYPNPYKINDAIQITVKEAWIEKQWVYSSTKNNVKTRENGYQLAININEGECKGEGIKWLIGSYNSIYLRQSSCESLIGDFNNMPSDTIKYIVQNGNLFPNDSNGQIIGYFILAKKVSVPDLR